MRPGRFWALAHGVGCGCGGHGCDVGAPRGSLIAGVPSVNSRIQRSARVRYAVAAHATTRILPHAATLILPHATCLAIAHAATLNLPRSSDCSKRCQESHWAQHKHECAQLRQLSEQAKVPEEQVYGKGGRSGSSGGGSASGASGGGSGGSGGSSGSGKTKMVRPMCGLCGNRKVSGGKPT